MSKERLVVVGNGMAGARAVEEILARGGGARYEVTVFGEEPYGNYNRILLSQVLTEAQDPRGIFLHPLGWYAENDITLHAGERVVRIDREARVVVSDRGRRVSYDRLLIATGSRPFVPPVAGLETAEGEWKAGLFVFRTLDDCRRIAGYSRECRTAAVVGGGLLGLEAARGLRDLGLQVTVVHQAGHLMNQQLDAQGGAILKGSVERLGVEVVLSRTTVCALGEDQVTGLEFSDGTTLACDLVVFACGVRPNVALARECGLAVSRAVVVDDQLRSVDDPRVFAVGECAEHRRVTYGVVAPLWEQANVLADHLAGRPDAAYRGSRVTTRLKVMGIELATMGIAGPELDTDEVVHYQEPRRGIYKKLVIRDNVLVGAILLGDPERAPYLTQAFDRGTQLPEERSALLFSAGGAGAATTVDEMPEDATVCHCNGVSKGEIRACAGTGVGLHGVMRHTRAGTGCGSCKTLVRTLVDRCAREAAAQPVPLVGVEA